MTMAHESMNRAFVMNAKESDSKATNKNEFENRNPKKHDLFVQILGSMGAERNGGFT